MASPKRDQYKPGSGKILKDDDTVLDVAALLVRLDTWLSASESAGADASSNTRASQPVASRVSGFNGTTWDRLKAGITAVTATLTGFLNTLPWGVYNATPTTRTEGQGGPLQTNNKGSLNSTQTTLTEGEDQTYHVLKTQVRATYTPPITASGLVFTGPGQFMGYIVNSCGAGATVKVWDSLTGATTVVMDTATFTAAEAQGPKPVVLPVAVQLGTGCYITITGTISLTPLWNQ